MKTDTQTLAQAMRIIAGTLKSDGVANSTIAEAAERLEESEQRIAALVDTIRQLSNDVVNGLNERDALAAHVELLKKSSAVVLDSRDGDGITTSGLAPKFDALAEALAATPAQCLAEIKVQAGIEALLEYGKMVQGISDYLGSGAQFAIPTPEQYANTIRSEARTYD